MSFSSRVREIWRHNEPGLAPYDYKELVRYATLAASSHNTQPWIFRLEPNRIRILPDLSRRCPAVDPDDHHLYASLGCATENLLLAARAVGLQGTMLYDASTSGVGIDFEEAPPVRSALFEAIPQRQCSRSMYDGLPLTVEELKQLKDASHGNGVSALFITAAEQKDLVARYVAEGNDAQFSDAAWACELKSWIRFNGKEALRTGDGLYGPSMGSPAVPRWLGLAAMRFSFSAKNQNKKDLEHIRSSSAIAIISSEGDDIPHWIEAGRCFQRVALQATALGLRTAFINQPVEVTKLRSEFARAMGIGNHRPDLVVRIGRGQEMPRSLRRPIEDVIV
jgi:nitroreductase